MRPALEVLAPEKAEAIVIVLKVGAEIARF